MPVVLRVECPRPPTLGAVAGGAQALLLKEAAKHYGVVRQMPEPFIMEDEDLVFQCEPRGRGRGDRGPRPDPAAPAGTRPASTKASTAAVRTSSFCTRARCRRRRS